MNVLLASKSVFRSGIKLVLIIRKRVIVNEHLIFVHINVEIIDIKGIVILNATK